jgi:hypothetical protein
LFINILHHNGFSPNVVSLVSLFKLSFHICILLYWERAVKKSDERDEMRESDEEIKCNG